MTLNETEKQETPNTGNSSNADHSAAYQKSQVVGTEVVKFILKHRSTGIDWKNWTIPQILQEISTYKVLTTLDNNNNITGLVVYTEIPEGLYIRHILCITKQALRRFIEISNGRPILGYRRRKEVYIAPSKLQRLYGIS